MVAGDKERVRLANPSLLISSQSAVALDNWGGIGLRRPSAPPARLNVFRAIGVDLLCVNLNRTVGSNFGSAVQPHSPTRGKLDRNDTHLTICRQVIAEGIACCGLGVDSHGVFIHHLQESRGARQ
jgi:hypothetical protein